MKNWAVSDFSWEKWNGDLEIKSKYPDLNQPLGTPGSPMNPIIIKREQ
jgi:hypothetical protein